MTKPQAPASLRPRFDRNQNPKKLARFSRQVTRTLNANPYVQHVDVPNAQIYVYQGFLPLADCQLLLDRIETSAVPSTLYEGTETEGFRTSYSCHMNRWDTVVARIDSAIAAVLGIDSDYSETIQGQRYLVGQQFKPHHDYFHITESYWQMEGPRGGQRSWTAMIFLNEPEAGGETEFPQLGIGVRPQTGMMLIWNNMTMEGAPNPHTLHAGTPVKAGAKYIVTKWFRQENWIRINTPEVTPPEA